MAEALLLSVQYRMHPEIRQFPSVGLIAIYLVPGFTAPLLPGTFRDFW